jgi:hypothetical protein
MRVCVFASSSSRVNSEFGAAASELGALLSKEGMEIIFGGGAFGLMKILADAILENKGKITGVIPVFMKEAGWCHEGITDIIITGDMSERKKRMLDTSEAVIALPGGIGTLEELTETITLKQLGLWNGPIIILNTLGYYNNLVSFIDHMISNHFMRPEHGQMWKVANTPREIINMLTTGEKTGINWREISRF